MIPQRGMEIFNTIGTAGQVTVTVERNGQTQDLTLNMAQVNVPDANGGQPATPDATPEYTAAARRMSGRVSNRTYAFAQSRTVHDDFFNQPSGGEAGERAQRQALRSAGAHRDVPAHLHLGDGATAAQQQPPSQQATITPAFRDAELTEIIDAVATITGKTFIVDPRVRAQVTIRSATPMTPDAFYQTFLSILQVHGFIAVPSGDNIKILPDANARRIPGNDLPSSVNPNSTRSSPRSSRFVTSMPRSWCRCCVPDSRRTVTWSPTPPPTC